MPRIPVYEAGVLPSVSPGAARAGGMPSPLAGLEGLGQVIGDLGDRLVEAERVRELNEATVRGLKEITDLEMAHINDPEQDPTAFEEKAKEITETISSGIKIGGARIAFNNQMGQIMVQKRYNVIRDRRRKDIEKGIAGADNWLKDLRSVAGKAKTDMEYDQVVSLGGNIITGMERAGFIDARIAEKMRQKWAGELEVDQVRADIMGDPRQALEDLSGQVYTNIDEGTRLTLMDRAMKRAEMLDRREVQEANRIEKEIEKIRKETIADNDMGVWQDYYGGELNHEKLEEMARGREISEDVYTRIREKIKRGEDEANDPEVLGDIAYAIGAGMDVRDGLKSALLQGKIKGDTFLNFMGNIGNKRAETGLRLITTAMKPSDNDRFRADKNYKMEQALEKLHSDIKAGMDPVESAVEIVDSYSGDVRRNVYNLPRPRYLQGERAKRLDMNALGAAMSLTVEEYQSGNLTDEEYKYEMDNISSMMGLAGEAEMIMEEAKEYKEQMRKR